MLQVLSGSAASEASDMYSFGIVLWELLSRRKPYEGVPLVKVKERVLAGGRPELPEGVPRAYVDLVQSAWAHDPASRPSFSCALERLHTMANSLD